MSSAATRSSLRPLTAALGPANLAILVTLVAVTAASSAISYLLFHSLVELFAITVGFMTGVVGWYTFRFSRNHLLAFLAAAYPFVAAIDLVHTLAYQGMGVFADGANLPTQLWVAGRALEAAALLLAPTFLVRPVRPGMAVAGFASVTVLLLGLIGFGRFPEMYVTGVGLTATKIVSEYVIIGMLLTAGYRLWRRRDRLDPQILGLIGAALALTMLGELLFTFYIGVYDLSNMLGHLTKLVSFWLVFVALVRTTLVEPFRVLSRNSTTYDAIPEAIAVVDAEGIIRQVNRVLEQRFGNRLRLGDSSHERFHPRGPQSECAACAAIGAGRAVERMELFYPEEGRWRELTLSPIHDPLASRGMVHVLRDITERKRNEEELKRLNRALRTVSTSNQTLIHAANEDALLHDVCRVVVETGGYRLAWVGFLSEAPGRPVLPQAWAGDERGYLAGSAISWGESGLGPGPAGTAARTGDVIITNDIASEPDSTWRRAALERGFAAAMAFPLLDSGGHPRGVLAIYAGEPHVFGRGEVAILSELAGDLSYGINALRASAARVLAEERAHEWEQRLAGSLKQTVGALAGIVEQRDPYTAGHQRRVAALAVAIGRALKLDPQRLEGLSVAGLVHDVGKIHVPMEVLSRPGRLSDLEFDLMKLHAESGFRILQDVSFPWPVAEMVHQHHERLDGSGYPKGASGEAVLLESRILAVADVVEAMASHRPYRPALGLKAALEEIERGSGKVYDSDAVSACIRVFREQGFRWTEEAMEVVGGPAAAL